MTAIAHGAVLRNAGIVDLRSDIAVLLAMCGPIWLGWLGARSVRKVLA